VTDRVPAGTIDDPFFSINWAIYQAQAPATVVVMPGEYANKGSNDLHISMKTGVDLICQVKQQCIIHGPVYGASHTVLDGFVLAKAEQTNSVREIFLGVSRYGSPVTGNIHAPEKRDIYPKSVTKMVVRNNVVSDNSIRLAGGTFGAPTTVIDDTTNQRVTVPQGTPTEVNDNLIEANVQFLDRADSHYWGITLINSHGNTIKDNDLQSGRAIVKHDPALHEYPNNPAAILIQNAQNNVLVGNKLLVHPDANGRAIGACAIVHDIAIFGTASKNNTFNNTCRGRYAVETADYAAAICGDGTCQAMEHTDPFGGDSRYCAQDCCGDGICAASEASKTNPKDPSLSSPHHCAADC
jgi:hypothetical protein